MCNNLQREILGFAKRILNAVSEVKLCRFIKQTDQLHLGITDLKKRSSPVKLEKFGPTVAL